MPELPAVVVGDRDEVVVEQERAIEGKRALEIKVRATPQTWRRELVPVTIEGLEPCLKLFGVGELGPDDWPRL